MLRGLRNTQKFPALLAAVLIGLALPIFAAAPTVSIAVTGTPVPGATVTAKANVTITDGSTLQSITWTQKGGPTATVLNANTDTITVTLPDRKTFKHHLIEVLEEAPIAEANYPDYLPPATGHFTAGLQNRWGIVASSPHAVIDAGNLVFEVETVTSSGKYKNKVTLVGKMPWTTSIGVNAVPLNVPVIVHGKKQASYNWALTAPAGSNAKLIDATTQDPDFTPDVKGTYKLTVTDLAKNTPVTITIYAGNYKGIVVGKDPATNRPIVTNECKTCHAGKIEMFTPWAQSGHAEIFTDSVNTRADYRAECLVCHVVGYNTSAANGGFDDASDFSVFPTVKTGTPLTWSTFLEKMPEAAKLANIQCDNCHGPQDTDGHALWGEARMNISSDLCGTCHGEPVRHGRYQQWQLSKHGDYETASVEGLNPSCTKCHSGQGFIQWAKNGFSTAAIKVDWTADTSHPLTCVVCHDPHDVGTTSGSAATNAPMRVQGTTPMLDAGFLAKDVGKSAICMTCHNGRRGLRNDTIAMTDFSRAPHVGPQADVLMGQNFYFVTVGQKGYHGSMADACVACHMEKTDPPASLAYYYPATKSYGGTNHTFFASKTICVKCHSNISLASVQHEVEVKLEHLKHEIEKSLMNAMQAQIRAGNQIELATTPVTRIKSAADIKHVEFEESHGRQAIGVTLADGKTHTHLTLNNVKVVRPTGSSVELYATMDPNVAKAGWNYFMIHSDKSHGVHNPTLVKQALEVSLFAVKNVNNVSTTYNPVTATAKLGGGLGNGAGAVGCTTPYVYWTEMAGHVAGNAGSQWRTDLVARNLGTKNATLKFILHTESGKIEGPGAINASSQKAFENIASAIGAVGKMGALELCSDQPLLVASRTFNQTDNGTYGQAFEGQVADVGYAAGQTVSLIGLRQKTGAYRSNVIITNAGKTAAEVSVTLYDAAGTSLKTYTMNVAPGSSTIDVEPYKNRAAAADVDWGFATVTIVKGTNIWASGSMIDMKSNDPVTVQAKQ